MSLDVGGGADFAERGHNPVTACSSKSCESSEQYHQTASVSRVMRRSFLGWAETNNDLEAELDGGYEGISVAVPFQAVSSGTLGAVHKITDTPRGAGSDCELPGCTVRECKDRPFPCRRAQLVR